MSDTGEKLSEKSRAFFANIEKLFTGVSQSIKGPPSGGPAFPKNKADFKQWAKAKLKDSKEGFSRSGGPLYSSFRDLVVSLGVNETLFAELFVKNKNQTYESLFGETIAVLALVFAWSDNDREEFSQTLGEVGAASLFSLNPLTALITIVGLAIGYNRLLHPNALKKGAIVGTVGLGVSTLMPGGYVVSLIAALIAVIIVNKRLDTRRPIEEQISEIVEKIKTSDAFSQLQAALGNIRR